MSRFQRVLFLLIIFSFSISSALANIKPIALFSYSPVLGVSPVIASFNSSGSSDPDGSVSLYIWDFGDGNTLETTNPIISHTYRYILPNCTLAKGTLYKISLIVKDNNGLESTKRISNINVRCEKNVPPTVGSNQSVVVSEDQISNFQLNPGSDADNNPLTYHLVSAPAQGLLENCLDGTGSLSCKYTPPLNFNGPVTIKYRVSDGVENSVANATININVLAINDAPTMIGNQSVTTSEDNFINFTLNGAIDVEGNALNYRLITPPSSGSLENCLGLKSKKNSLNCKYVPAPDFNGSVTFSYIANDGLVDAATASTVTIQVNGVNDYPIMLGDDSFVQSEDSIAIFNLKGASDSDSANLTYRIIQSPTNGTLVDCLGNDGDLSCRFIPNQNFNGTVTFSYKANDGLSDSTNVANVTIVFESVNDLPMMGENQSFSTLQNQALNFTLNPALDADGDELVYEVVIPAANGLLTGCIENNNDLTCTFTPSQGFSGNIQFSYRAYDGTSNSTTESVVSIDVISVNSAPIMIGNDSFTGSEDQEISFNLKGATDPNLDNLTYLIVQSPSNGSLINCLNETDDLSCTFIPNQNFNGTVTFSYRAFDGVKFSDTNSTVTLIINPSNDAPVMAQAQIFTMEEDGSLSFDLIDATDVDGDSISYRLVSPPSNGLLSNCLNNDGDLSCIFKPHSNFSGTVTFEYIANDGSIDAAQPVLITIQVSAVNDAPVMLGNQTFEINEDTISSFTLNGATDSDENNLSYTLVTSPTNGTLSNCLEGTDDLTCIFTPDVNFNGIVSFSYKASDGTTFSGTNSVVTINILPVNDVPVVGADQTFFGYEDSPISFSLSSGHDADGDFIFYTLIQAPSSGTLEGCLDGTILNSCTYVPEANFSGEVTFTYKVSDTFGDSLGVAVVTLNIMEVNDSPVMIADQAFSMDEDGVIEIQLAGGTDAENDQITYTLINEPTNSFLEDCLGGTSDLVCNFRPSSDFNGEVTFTYKASDGISDSVISSVVSVTVLPVNDAPLVGDDQLFITNQGVSLSFGILPSTDIDGDNLTYKIVQTVSSGDLSGCLNNDGDLSCEYTPADNFVGEVLFRYRAYDSVTQSEGIATGVIRVVSTNSTPVLTNSTLDFSINEDESLEFTLPAAIDDDNDDINYRLISPISAGTLEGCLTQSASLVCKFIPSLNFNGIVTFSYVANDGKVDSNKVEVNINVLPVNDAPRADDIHLVVNWNQSTEFNLSKAYDVDGDDIDYELVTPPLGTLSGCLNSTESMSCKYTPPNNFFGNTTLTFKAQDGMLSSNLITVHLQVIKLNRPPEIVRNFTLNLEEDEVRTLFIGAVDPDGGGGAIYLETPSSDVEIIRDPSQDYGLNTAWIFKSKIPDWSGVSSASFYAHDGKNRSVNNLDIVINISPLNDPPVPAQDQHFEINEDESFMFTINKATDVDTSELILSYGLLGGYPTSGIISECMNGTNDLTCRYTPEPGYSGLALIGYSVSDGIYGPVQGWIHINVNAVNDKPYFLAPQVATIFSNIKTTLQIESAFDSDQDGLVYQIVELPTGINVTNCLSNNNDRLCDVESNPDFVGEGILKVRAFDSKEYSDIQTVRFIVAPAHQLKVNQIATGGHHTCALLESGDMKCWGYNLSGQLGIGNTNNQFNPSLLSSIDIGEKVIQITAGSNTTCALLASKNVKCWGSNSAGALGIGNTNSVAHLTPRNIPNISLGGNAVQISHSGGHGCALLENGTVRCWGSNIIGQLGLGHTQNIGDNELPSSVTTIPIGQQVTSIGAFGFHTCAILINNTVKCWGNNSKGQLGQGNLNTIGDNELPSTIPSINLPTSVTQIVGGHSFVCALMSSGNVKCWGDNMYATLGQGHLVDSGSTLPSNYPNVSIGNTVSQISALGDLVCTLMSDKNIKCWGRGTSGSTGRGTIDGTIGDNELPSDITAIDLGSLNNLVVSSGSAHACALLPTKNMKCWGSNQFGQLGRVGPDIGDNETPATIGSINIGLMNSLAQFIFSPDNAPVDSEIYFDASDSLPSDSEGSSIVSYVWDYGDGSTGAGVTSTHAYDTGGRFVVKLTTLDTLSVQAVTTRIVTVIPPPQPTAHILSSTEMGNASLQVNFNGILSTPSEMDLSILSYSWDFGDGQLASGAIVDHVYTTPGVYVARLSITDSKNRVAHSNVSISVKNPLPPVAVANSSQIVGRVPLQLTFTGISSTPGSFDGEIISYAWSFGDGSTASGASVQHTFVNPGVYQVKLIVKDDRGNSSEDTLSIEAAPASGAVASIASSSSGGIRPIQIQFDGSNSLSSTSEGEIVEYHWTFGDGSTAMGANVAHEFLNQGSYVVTLKVTDEAGQFDSETTIVEVLPVTPPVANFTFDENSLYSYVPIEVQLDASVSSQGNGPTLASYEWFVSDGTSLSGEKVAHTFASPGQFNIVLRVTNIDGDYAEKTISKTYLDSLSLNLSAENNVLFEGQASRVKTLLLNSDRQVVDLPILWNSSNESVLSIVNGSMQALQKGEAFVTAKVGTNLSEALKITVKERTSSPQLKVDDDFFLKSYESFVGGGVFGLSVGSFMKSLFSVIPKTIIKDSGYFNIPLSVPAGVHPVDFGSYNNFGEIETVVKNLRYFDGRGSSLSFDGVDDEASFELSPLDSNILSLSLWLRLDETLFEGTIFELYDPSGKGIKLAFDSKKVLYFQMDTNKTPLYLNGSELKTNEWTHVSVQLDFTNRTMSLFQNSKKESIKRIHWDAPWKTSALKGSFGNKSYKGLLDEMIIFEKKLSESEIKELMFAGAISDPPKYSFSFDGKRSQKYFSKGESNSVILGSTVGLDNQDPELRFASRVLAKMMMTPNEGGVLAEGKFIFELPPYSITQAQEFILEYMDAKTAGFTPAGIDLKEYLIRVHPTSENRFEAPGTLSIPLNTELLKETGAINLFHYRLSQRTLNLRRAIKINTNEQVVSFPILKAGTYFSSYDPSIVPNISYAEAQISETAFNYDWSSIFKIALVKVGQGPFSYTLVGDSDGAELYSASCDNGAVVNNASLPMSITGLKAGKTRCELYYSKMIDGNISLILPHLIYIHVRN